MDAFDEMRGYLVRGPDGEIGILDECRRNGDGRPATLIIAQGWFGRRRVEVPVADLMRIDHERELIHLAPGAAPPYRSLTQRLVTITRRPLESNNGGHPVARSRDPVICGVGEPEHLLALVAVAGGLARHLDSPLLLTQATPRDGDPATSVASASRESVDAEHDEEAEHFVDVLLSGVAGGTDIGRLAVTERTKTLAQIAADESAVLLVVGSGSELLHESSGLDSAACSEAVRAPCPVVVVPHGMTHWAPSKTTSAPPAFLGWSYGLPFKAANEKE